MNTEQSHLVNVKTTWYFHPPSPCQMFCTLSHVTTFLTTANTEALSEPPCCYLYVYCTITFVMNMKIFLCFTYSITS